MRNKADLEFRISLIKKELAKPKKNIDRETVEYNKQLTERLETLQWVLN